MFEERLHQLEEQHLLRRLQLIDSEPGPIVTIEGCRVILMASNNYLGLATHPKLKHAAVSATERFGVGSGASRLVSGTLPPHQELETALARFKSVEAALVFTSGYLANIGLIPALIGSGGLILADRLSHASLIDGCKLSGADLRIFRHRDTDQLRTLLARRSSGLDTLIVTDGVFRMAGDEAPLRESVELSDPHGARRLVYDAHWTRCMGPQGRGT